MIWKDAAVVSLIVVLPVRRANESLNCLCWQRSSSMSIGFCETRGRLTMWRCARRAYIASEGFLSTIVASRAKVRQIRSSQLANRIAAYSAWLKTASLPKLFIDAEPGVFITGRIRRLSSSFPNQHRVAVRGLHFVQEDTPDEIGRANRGHQPARPTAALRVPTAMSASDRRRPPRMVAGTRPSRPPTASVA